ncbi:mitochondrial mRNA processing protein PET127, putative [Aspergillus fumigatus Af293]|uniref:Mitochondrial mRNA processing protein PET127, putative n=1 Tax=Aspergillus fumigatus (strain ATCC MYA-4609 / CBS 101355 / FGSC A1100 / Af293) TaxID=330879 RepID=Q4WDH0_ASPFU|nr:mitochondrial mRNA processing protein PET127, putative [Aspergillus fumigatus Af293]EAL85568.1 mitochondrial mRNA processing protein PET127, putative [Aspergillus fumigatus Af293]
MFRTSVRSLKDPLREHVCFSCLAEGLGGRPRMRQRQFYNSSVSRAKSGNGQASNEDVADSIVRRVPGISPSSSPSPSPSPSASVSLQEQILKTLRDDDADKRSEARRKRRGSTPGTGQPIRKETVTAKIKRTELSALEKVKPGKPGAPFQGEDTTARLQSSLQSVVTLLDSRGADLGGRETIQTLTTNARSIVGRHSGELHSEELSFTPHWCKALDIKTAPVPRLSFGLDRVLFNPGVYHLRDPRSRVFNFDPYLGSIMPVTEFDFDALKEYITSSRDEILRGIAEKEKKKYVGSSSSMTSVLSHFHYLLSSWRPIDARNISQGFPDKLRTFTRLLRAPAAMFLRYQDGVYAIDADKEFDSANILMNLGKSLEKLLTLPKEDFERYRRTSTNKISPEEEQAIPEAYHYSTMGDFVMRSQLDAYDPRLPGTGMFDLKTRAVVSIRMDVRNFEHGLGYEIRHRFGGYESYEREFFDMIRAAFLKYSLQVRIGRMDGIFVAFHNVERIFGFQYVSLSEMDQTLHGQSDTSLGDTEFQLSLALWNKILDKATAKFPKRSLRFHFETRDAQTPFMYIFAEPVTDDEIHAIQTKNQEKIEAYQRRILNLPTKERIKPKPTAAPSELKAGSQPATLAKDHTAESSDKKKGSSQKISTTSDVDQETPATSEGSPASGSPDAPAEDAQEAPRELLAMTLIVKNKMNGYYVERPTNFTASDKWTVQWELTEVKQPQAQSLYTACQNRRAKALEIRGEGETGVAANVYIRKLREIAKQGREFRQKEDELDKKQGIVVLDGAV